MTRLGWSILIVIVVTAGLFASMLSFGRHVAPGRDAGPAVRAITPDRAALIVPVAGVAPSSIVDSWGQARAGGRRSHQGTDIPAPGGTPVIAAASGRIDKLFDSKQGGKTIYLRSPDGRLIFYYAHLAGYAPGLREGQAVQAGERIGFVGDTGNAGAGNTHLHFGMTRTVPEAGWWQGQPINPYPMLARSGRGR